MVVAIIGLLAAMLLPALARSKASAQRIKCLSNLHQLGLATQMYWDDNSGNCFRYGGGASNGGQLYWFGWIGSGPEGQRAFDATPGALYPYLRGRGVEVCPAFQYAAADVKLKATGATYGYGYNLYLSTPLSRPAFNIGWLREPSNRGLLADAAQVNTWQAPASPTHPMLEEWYYIDNSTNQPNVHFRHQQKAQLVFCDGHVDALGFFPGSIDNRLPSACVGRFSPEILAGQGR